jgi:hypothetical protein
MEEVWKEIPEYEGYYVVSNLGRVKRIKESKFSKCEPLKPQLNQYGYLHVILCKEGNKKIKRVHTLVASTFLAGLPSNSSLRIEVNHKNGIKGDNRLVNLEYVTQAENMQHAFKTGLNKNIGSTHSNSKLNEDAVKNIYESKEKIKLAKLAKMYKISKSTISDIWAGRTWVHLTKCERTYED